MYQVSQASNTVAAPRFAKAENVAASMSSAEIAELVGSRHDNVKRTIETLAGAGVISQPHSEDGIKSANGVVPRHYLINKRDSFVVVAQLCPEFTAALVDRWQELEAQAVPALPNPLETARLLVASLEETQRVTAERDAAIATKALIGSKREATAMATASAAKRQVKQLEAELGRNEHHATVIAVERATGTKLAKNAYVALRRWCKANDKAATEVTDPRYGSVKAWPAGAWLAAFGVDLAALFGGVAQ